jgi:hypothetical protein
MKHTIHLVLAGLLAFGPLGCSRDQVSPDQPVSANTDHADRADRLDSTEPPTAEPRKAAPRRAEPRREESRRVEQPRSVEPEREVENRATESESVTRPVAKARATENVPAETPVTVVLLDGLSTETNQVGDEFSATLAQPIVVNGKVVADKGDKVTGEVKNIEEAGRVKGRARLELVLKNITTSNRTYKVSTEPFVAVAGDSKDRDAGMIAGGAGVGAIIGAATGGKKGAAIGAIIGGGTGTTAVLVTKGKQVKLAPETRVNFVLSNDVDLPVIRSATT